MPLFATTESTREVAVTSYMPGPKGVGPGATGCFRQGRDHRGPTISQVLTCHRSLDCNHAPDSLASCNVRTMCPGFSDDLQEVDDSSETASPSIFLVAPEILHWHQPELVITRRPLLNGALVTRSFHSADLDTKTRLQPKRVHCAKLRGLPRT